MSGRSRSFVAALLLSISFIECRAQAYAPPKLFLIWDERGKFGYIDPSGRTLIKPQFDRAYPFAEGVAAVGVGNKSGFINASGKPVGARNYQDSPLRSLRVPRLFSAVNVFRHRLTAEDRRGFHRGT
jgi:WG repeat protein